jgi:aldehyde dehydrogenase
MTDLTTATATGIEAEALVAGEWVKGSSRSEVRNPADIAEIVGTAPVLTPADVDQAVGAAVSAQRRWATTSAVERAALVVAGTAAAARLESLAETLTREQGKVVAESGIEIDTTVGMAQHYQALAESLDQVEHRSSSKDGFVDVFRRPVGVVGLITPNNWPYALTLTKLVPALIAGNAVVVKPAPTTPFAVIAAVRALAERLPEGLVSVVTGGDDVPRALVTHPDVRMISFTGSTRTGRAVAADAAGTIKNVSLELGGNDAGIVLDDVEVTPEFVQRIVQAAFTTSGQVCFALKRLYVPASKLDAVTAGLVAALDHAVVGNGLDPATTMAPLHNRAQRDIVVGMIDDARSRGAVVRECGTLAGDPDRGWFLRPAVVWNVPDDAPLVAEEQFGPALPVLAYDDEADAIRRANATEYGLTSSVWSADEQRAALVARHLEAGSTAINRHGLPGLGADAPFGGVKQSGVGRDLSREGLLAYTEKHAIALVR